MKKLMKKKVSVFGKKLPVFVIALLAIGVVSAAVIPYFAQITGLVTVTSQGLLVDGLSYPATDTLIEEWNGQGFTSFDSRTYIGGHSLKNLGASEVSVGLTTICVPGDTSNNDCVGVTCSFVSGANSGDLLLENKNPSDWTEITGDTISANLHYDIDGTSFYYDLSGTVPKVSTNYVLIYYADRQDRFVNWGGDNPGALIATFTSDGSGNIPASIKGTIDIATVLPNPVDWNANPSPDYCDVNGPDKYPTCSGAKIWLVPATDYNDGEKKLTGWNPENYLFETDLITSFNGAITSPVKVLAGETVNFGIKCVFQEKLVPDTYTITTTVDVA